jgi:hypothetical protein
VHLSVTDITLNMQCKDLCTFAAPPIQYFWADSQGALITNSSGSFVVRVSIPQTRHGKSHQSSILLTDFLYRHHIIHPLHNEALHRNTYIAAMAKLSHSKAAPDNIIFRLLQLLIMMSLCSIAPPLWSYQKPVSKIWTGKPTWSMQTICMCLKPLYQLANIRDTDIRQHPYQR